jgi:C-terminal processing protease CtpA/Prc
VDLLRQDAEKPCPTPNPCAPEKPSRYMSLVPSAPASEFYGKPWGKAVFAPAEYRYRNGEWDGPLLVLVDERTGSAAENFAAILQDNHAAIIFGSRTVGSGGGYVDGGTPTTLKHSGGVLIVPDNAIFRADGSNEVEGVIPDVQIGIRFTDGAALKSRLIMAHLSEALRLAKAQYKVH